MKQGLDLQTDKDCNDAKFPTSWGIFAPNELKETSRKNEHPNYSDYCIHHEAHFSALKDKNPQNLNI